ncbi:uncharacterized protein YaiL (DUF2058 family) [Actinokineospora baliensis]|uniref:hypothetical protein n=1 Tax=Actinokineospora baliensis TaxID=547056 RepID=UPI00195CDF3D|nr:hypothetical protein [Actinokineospora baliensis]MBM7770615.1 uncharacterized protein YaiL (DUF2058 family) [Actinokineospora baliensis]
MATHKITYTTTEPPTGLPAGASVELLDAFPVKISTPGSTLTARRRTSYAGRPALVELRLAPTRDSASRGEVRTVGLDEKAARELGEALVKAADDAKTERAERERQLTRAGVNAAAARLARALEPGIFPLSASRPLGFL